MTGHAWIHLRRARPLRLVGVSTAMLGLLLVGLVPAVADDGTDSTDRSGSTEHTEEHATTGTPTLSWGDLRVEASLVCEPERPLAGQELTCQLTEAVGFDAADVTFGVLRLLDEYDEGQRSELVQEEARRVPIDVDGDAPMTFVVSAAALPGDVYDVAVFESSTTACYAAVPLADDHYDLDDGVYTILAGPGTLTVDDDEEGFAIDGEAFRLDDAEPICHYIVAWTGGEVGGTAPPDEPPLDDGDDPTAPDPDEGTDEPATPAPETTTEADEPAAGTHLPATGIAVGWWALLGGVLLAGGLTLTLTRRRTG